MNEEHLVLGLRNDDHLAQEIKKSVNVMVDEESDIHDDNLQYAAIAIVEAPHKDDFSLRRIYLSLKYWLLDKIDPCLDPGGVMEVCSPHIPSGS